MGRITSNIGLISGIDYQKLVEQLVAIQSRPRDNLTAQVKKFDSQRTSITSLTATLIALQFNTKKLTNTSLYNQRTVSSSNEAALSATVSGQPTLGSYSLTPVRTAASQQLQSSRFASDTAALGAGTLTLRHGGFVDRGASLDLLNAGEGVDRGKIRITDRSGATAEIDLRFARDVDDVLAAINSSDTIAVTAEVSGDSIRLIDSSGSTSSNLKVQEVGSGTTAASLGLAGIDVAANSATGDDVLSLFGDLSLSVLNGGTGVRFSSVLPDVEISFRDGTTATVDFKPLDESTNEQTLADVLATLNAAAPGKLQAEIGPDGERIVLTDLTTDTGGTFAVTALNNSRAAADLGILGTADDDELTGGRLLSGLKSVLLANLNGTSGIGTLGDLDLTDRSGATASVDLSTAETLDDVVTAINNAAVSITASINAARNGITLTDTTGSTTSNLIVADGDANNSATKLKIAINAAATTVNSGSLNNRVLSENTKLASLNGGAGVGTGSLRITDTNGTSRTLTVDDDIQTIGDLLIAIDQLSLAVEARVNDAGDGIILIDTAAGSSTLAVASLTGSTARDLHLLGGVETIDVGGTPTAAINGSTTLNLEIDADDTLTDLVTKLNDSGFGLQAAAINDGSSVKPFRLTIFNNRSGKAGELLFDTSAANFSLTQTVAAQDALVVLGSPDAPTAVLATSATNTIANLLPGLTLNVKSASETPVTLTVGQTNTSLVSALKEFVSAYNRVREQVATLSKFDVDTNTAAVLQGDAALLRVDTDLASLVSRRSFGAGNIQSLAALGVELLDDGTLEFDETKFQERYSQDADAVKSYLSSTDTGLAARMDALLETLAGEGSSLLVSRAQVLTRKIDSGNDRVTFLEERLEATRTRLLKQFTAAENLIAKLQSNVSAIESIQPFYFARNNGNN